MHNKAAIGLFILGILLGGSGGWLIARPATSSPGVLPSPKSSVPVGWQETNVVFDDHYAILLNIRQTDRVARLKDADTIIGFKVFDQYVPQGGAAVDIVTKRVEEYFDLPSATSFDEYKQNRDGLTIQENREVTIHGQRAVKQLYTASIGQKRSDGAIFKRPQANLLRYVIEGPDHQYLILKASGAAQTYLDAIALSIQIVPRSQVNKSTDVQLHVDANEPTDIQPTNGAEIDLFGDTTGIGL